MVPEMALREFLETHRRRCLQTDLDHETIQRTRVCPRIGDVVIRNDDTIGNIVARIAYGLDERVSRSRGQPSGAELY